MKFQSCFLAATAAATMVGVAAPAHAFNFTFNNTAITFSANTTVDFSFVSSQGKFRSDLGVMEVGATGPLSGTFFSLFSEKAPGYDSGSGAGNDWLAVCGGRTIPSGSCSTSFDFLAGKTYTLALSRPSGSNQVSAGYVYSTDDLNTSFRPPNTYRQAFFSGDLFSAAGLTISFEDIGGKRDRAACAATGSTPTGDCDFNDFIVTARADAPTSVPEPTAMVGLGVAAVGLMSSRRRKANPAS